MIEAMNVTSQGIEEMTESVETPRISLLLGMIEKELSELEGCVKALDIRLDPALTPQPDSTVVGREENLISLESNMANRCRVINERIGKSTRSLHDIIRRIEI